MRRFRTSTSLLIAAVMPDPQKMTAWSSRAADGVADDPPASSRNRLVWSPVPDDSVWVFA